MEKINFIKSNWPSWPDDIGLVKTSKQEIESSCHKVGPTKDSWEIYYHTITIQAKRAKYHGSMNKLLKKFYSKHKDILILLYSFERWTTRMWCTIKSIINTICWKK